MNARRLILFVGAALLIAGVIALLVPVSVTGDGQSIGCGNAVAADSSEAEAANDKTVANVPILNQIVPHTDYVADCQAGGLEPADLVHSVGGGRRLAVLGSLAVPRTRTVS